MRPKKVILCVDDNEQDLSVLKFMLTTNGYRVLSANNGQEALGIFADNLVDLVLTDFAMPQMNGDQLVEQLKQIAAHVPMILLGDPQKMNGQMHGADALLAKKSLYCMSIPRMCLDSQSRRKSSVDTDNATVPALTCVSSSPTLLRKVSCNLRWSASRG